MKISATIMIKFCDESEAASVLKAVEPDNSPLPPGLRIETRQEGSTISFEIICERGPESLLSTVDDLLAAIQLAEKTICRRIAKV
ncbi:MAG: KEOPS complex subunit Pcc1 [Nitrososphaerota archaeon]